jgi:hypothetical protein
MQPGAAAVRASLMCSVRDIWNHRDLGMFTDSWGIAVASHDCAFIVISP